MIIMIIINNNNNDNIIDNNNSNNNINDINNDSNINNNNHNYTYCNNNYTNKKLFLKSSSKFLISHMPANDREHLSILSEQNVIRFLQTLTIGRRNSLAAVWLVFFFSDEAMGYPRNNHGIVTWI